jgi:hypothetical protein
MTDTVEPLPDLFDWQVWLAASPPGAKLTYARNVPWLDQSQRTVARAAYKAYELGLVELCQRRCADGTGFDYIAQKRKEIIRPFQPAILRGDIRKG